jgi:hypothetical protein
MSGFLTAVALAKAVSRTDVRDHHRRFRISRNAGPVREQLHLEGTPPRKVRAAVTPGVLGEEHLYGVTPPRVTRRRVRGHPREADVIQTRQLEAGTVSNHHARRSGRVGLSRYSSGIERNVQAVTAPAMEFIGYVWNNISLAPDRCRAVFTPK